MITKSVDALFELERFERLEPGRLFSLDERVAVVTGAAGGIGRWLAAGLAKAGATVVLTDRAESPPDDVVAALRDTGREAVSLTVDLNDKDAAQTIVEFARARYGRLDVLVNNAGINKRIPMLEATSEDVEEIWTLNYKRCYELSQAAVRVMTEQHNGSIINISSLSATVGLEAVSLYAPAKAALSQLTKVMAVEFGHLGVRTNAIAPGFMATAMNASHWEHPTRAPWIMDRTPLCRPGHPVELVGLCLLLASDAGSFINGQTIFVDGGFTAGSRWSVAAGTGLAIYKERLASETLYGSTAADGSIRPPAGPEE